MGPRWPVPMELVHPAHSDGLTALGDASFALAFSGHVHGGQSNAPRAELAHPVKRAVQPAISYGGVLELGLQEHVLVVSMGQGSLYRAIRADPEVHVCDLTS